VSGVLAAIISGVCTIIVALIYVKLQQVHQLVNSRLDTAIQEIEDLKSERSIARGQPGTEPPPAG
jgi:hypothetical protein